MPEALTPLFFTPSYTQLTEEQRLRYNQLHACYFNEQTIFFESVMAQPILKYFAARPLPEDLRGGLRVFMAEEARHSAMFRAINRQCHPERYVRAQPGKIGQSWCKTLARYQTNRSRCSHEPCGPSTWWW